MRKKIASLKKGVRSIIQRYGSGDPDLEPNPHQNVTKDDFLKLVVYLSLSVLRRAVRLCLVLLLLPLDCLAHL
jgi:hypothetical protein